MALRPKLEFYTIKLVAKDLAYNTFREFAIQELYERRPSSDAQIMYKLFDYFMKQLATDNAKDKSIKKQLKLIKTSSNKHLENRPVVNVQKNIIYGVINGGRFGRDGMMSDSSADAEEARPFSDITISYCIYHWTIMKGVSLYIRIVKKKRLLTCLKNT